MSELFFIGFSISLLVISVILYDRSRGLIRAYTAVLMICIALFAVQEINVFGLRSNVGNIFYAVITFNVSYTTWHQYRRNAFVYDIFIILLIIHGIFAVCVSDFLQPPAYVKQAVSLSFQVVTASYVAFLIAQSVNVYMVKRTNKLWLSQITAQAFDSAIFFPLAFFNLNVNVLGFMISGFILKSIIALFAEVVFRVDLKLNMR